MSNAALFARFALFALAGLVLGPLACGESAMPTQQLAVVVSPDAEHSALRFTDRDLVSWNEQCPMTGAPLNTVIEPIYINGRPLGFC